MSLKEPFYIRVRKPRGRGGGEDPRVNVQIIRSELGATFSLGQNQEGWDRMGA